MDSVFRKDAGQPLGQRLDLGCPAVLQQQTRPINRLHPTDELELRGKPVVPVALHTPDVVPQEIDARLQEGGDTGDVRRGHR